MKLIKVLGIKKKPTWKRGERFGLFECPVCNKLVEKKMSDGLSQQRCSRACYAATRTKRGAYKERVINNKYVYLYRPDHPHAIGTRKLYVAEHRLVMENAIGRYLTEDEVIHHKDGNTMNNVIDNLQLMTSGEHIRFHKTKAKRRVDGQFTI